MQLHPSAGAVAMELAGGRAQDGAVATRPDIEVSDREVDILRLLADGCDTAEVAEQLAFSESTIKNALARLMERFDARNRCQALAMAMRQGLI
jgi:DNA-binding NarL/FixJ family response regulator